jgi:hypothetical protein
MPHAHFFTSIFFLHEQILSSLHRILQLNNQLRAKMPGTFSGLLSSLVAVPPHLVEIQSYLGEEEDSVSNISCVGRGIFPTPQAKLSWTQGYVG